MAEPVIISYARGLLKEFPGVPEGTIDVIPVDFVVAAIWPWLPVAHWDRGWRRHRPGCVGQRQSARYGHLVDMVREWLPSTPSTTIWDSPFRFPSGLPGARGPRQEAT
ncbi:MAG: hypothetical protein Ct9H300mP31_17790 [Acidimicrobiaceae bacterium]|nr:MAG: hypothetical protein Ct9H300mP31_17790 [Acidimicrobiaceae bacterium]